MNTYTATFADGMTITRKSERGYSAAWRATWTEKGYDKPIVFTGFCASPEKANPETPSKFFCGNSTKGRAEAKRKNAEYREACGYRVEIVPARVA